jgi:hypothetical protein
MQPVAASGITGACRLWWHSSARLEAPQTDMAMDRVNAPLVLALPDWAWVTKDEVPKFLSPEMHDLVTKAF